MAMLTPGRISPALVAAAAMSLLRRAISLLLVLGVSGHVSISHYVSSFTACHTRASPGDGCVIEPVWVSGDADSSPGRQAFCGQIGGGAQCFLATREPARAAPAGDRDRA